jgi:hypothetical protein
MPADVVEPARVGNTLEAIKRYRGADEHNPRGSTGRRRQHLMGLIVVGADD